MAGQTKMIIITSDEDVIRRFSLNKSTNTQIIDLDNNTQMTSTVKDINLDFLAQLSELNSHHDQIYKRALDSSNENRSKSVKTQKKSIDIICTICGDRAIGFNYDVLSCASCKTFFRRNAYLDLGKIRCLTGQGQCLVAHGTARKCPRCRLDRCFAMGMRKDFMLSEQEKQRRKKHLEENRNKTTSSSSNALSNLHTSEQINHASIDDDEINVVHDSTDSNEVEDILFEMLSVEDWLTIQSIRSLFLSIFEIDTEQYSSIDVSDRITALITWSQFINRIALRFINFFRQINEFEDLHLDDRFILIKYNIFSVFPISKCFYYKPIDDCCSNDDNEAAAKHRRFFMLCGDLYGIRDTFVNNVHSLAELTEQDPTFLSLLSTILIFSQSLSMNENQPSLKDSLAVNRAQFYYTKVLWNYLVNKSGEIQACKHFTQLLTMIFRIQSMAKKNQEFFRVQYMTSDTVDRIAPIMQSVLHIS